MKIGFTGTRKGMTVAQIDAVWSQLAARKDEITEVHHGDCVGADEDFHWQCTKMGLRRVGHPPTSNNLRANCVFDEVFPRLPYLARNEVIVNMSDLVLATPAETTPQKKGGTWYTINYARKQTKPVIIIYPDGSMERK